MTNRTIGLDENLLNYLRDIGSSEHPVLTELRTYTASLPQHNMQIAMEQGQLLGVLIELLDIRHIIEVGTFTGYSSLKMALHLPPDGRITTCDVSQEWTDIAQKYWHEAGVAKQIVLKLGNARDTLQTLINEGGAGSFDMIFIDADKANYPHYVRLAETLLREGGLLAIDNVLWDGKVVDPDVNDEDTNAIRQANEIVRDHPDFTSVLVPIADGLILARKKAAQTSNSK